ncbi:MAG: S8 family serine peptidase, partial [Chloroflexota bacterium]
MPPSVRRFVLLLAILLGLTLTTGWLGASPAVQTPIVEGDTRLAYRPGRLIVKLTNEAASQAKEGNDGRFHFEALPSLAQLNQRYQVTAVGRLFPEAAAQDTVAVRYGLPNVFRLTAPATTDIWGMAAAYTADPHVIYAEPSLQAWFTTAPNDPQFPDQWSLNNTGQTGGKPDADIDWLEVWESGLIGPCGDPPLRRCVRVAVLDTGVDYNHPELDDPIHEEFGRDFYSNDFDPMDTDGHGTSVAGIVAAETHNAEGVAGLCWNCEVVPVRVAAWVIHLFDDALAEGIFFAASPAPYPDGANADVISMSLGGGCTSLWADAINYAYDQNVVIVSAAGNLMPFVVWPAKFNRAIAVAATNHNDSRAWWSSFGPEVDLSGPGVEVPTTERNNGYTSFSGTSAATPHVAATAALLLARNPNLTNAEIHQILRDTVDEPVPGLDYPNWRYGWGRINAYQAILQAPTPPADPYDPDPVTCPFLIDQVADSAPEGMALAALYKRLGSERLVTTPLGQALGERFGRHSQQVAYLATADPAVRGQIIEWLQAARPVVASWLDGDGRARLSSRLISQTETLVQFLSERASPGLAADLEWAWTTLNLR